MSAHLELFSWSENLLQRNLNIKNSTRCSFWFMKILVQRWLTHLSLKIIPFKTSEVNAKNFIQITKHLFIEKSSTTIMNDSYQFQVPLEVWRERKRSKWAWLDKAHRLSISIVIWILSSDTLFVSSTNSIQIVRRQCCLREPDIFKGGPVIKHFVHIFIIRKKFVLSLPLWGYQNSVTATKN